MARVAAALAPAACKVAGTGDSLRCTATPTITEMVFSARFGAFQHPERADVVAVVAMEPLVVPAAVRDDVVFVSGLTELPWRPEVLRRAVRSKLSNNNNKEEEEEVGVAAVSHTVVPDTIRLTYNVSAGAVAQPVVVAVAEFPGANYELESDLELFGTSTDLPNLTISRYMGPPNDPQADPTEASLDIQCVRHCVLATLRVWVRPPAGAAATARHTLPVVEAVCADMRSLWRG